MRQQSPGRVVDDDEGGAEVGKLRGLLDQRVDLADAPGAVDEARMKLLARIDDRAAGLAEVGDVVERVVEAEDVDAVLGCAGDEPSHDVFGDRLGADEEATAEGDPERCLRTGAERANPLPRALDSLRTAASNTPPPDTSRHAKPAPSRISAIRRTSPVGTLPGERLLREQADRGVDELGHEGGPSALTPGGRLAGAREPRRRQAREM